MKSACNAEVEAVNITVNSADFTQENMMPTLQTAFIHMACRFTPGVCMKLPVMPRWRLSISRVNSADFTPENMMPTLQTAFSHKWLASFSGDARSRN